MACVNLAPPHRVVVGAVLAARSGDRYPLNV
jgi:hypothetical protein